MNSDLKIIKKYYGEDMMHYARDNFSIILENEGKLSNLFLNNFAESKTLYEDLSKNNELVIFKNFIYRLYYEKIDKDNNEIINIKTPTELMNDAGYDLYECKTEDDIQSFKKYYSKEEELCTFKGGRLYSNRVFFAVKKNVDNIKRENFKNPEREDEYGTSVISIQFTKDGTNTLSIKNRYNHRVNNPDATFSNNLDNIIPGLTKSFEIHYGIKQKYINEESFSEFVRANDGKYYKYNYEVDNIYYCPNNIIIDNFKVKKYPKEKYIVLDYFILDLVEKEIESYSVIDSFPNTIKNINKIEIKKSGTNKIINISVDDSDENIEIIIDKNNRIISYKNNVVKVIENNFLIENITLKSIELKNVRYIYHNFLKKNEILENIIIPIVRKMGDCFLYGNKVLNNIYLPNVQIIGDEFLCYNNTLKEIHLPNVLEIGSYFLNYNNTLEKIYMPKVEHIEECFLFINNSIKLFDAPNLSSLGVDSFWGLVKYNDKINCVNKKLIELVREKIDRNNKIRDLNELKDNVKEKPKKKVLKISK